MRAVAFAVILALLGCASASQAAPAASGWHRSDLLPISQPAAVAGRFVVYAAAHGRVEVVALEARTGRTAWTEPASSASNAPGEPPTLVVAGNAVIYIAKVGTTSALAAVDAATGRPIWRSVTADFTSWPSLCPGNPGQVCVTAEGAAARFSVRTGAVVGVVDITHSGGGREIGEGLYDPELRHPEYMEGSKNEAISWQEKLSAVFTLPGASTDYGWNFDRYNRLGLFVGGPGWAPTKKVGKAVTFDLSHAMTAGFRIANGRAVWRNVGASYVCNYLPCPGESDASVSDPSNVSSEPTVGLRLRETGILVASTTSGKPPQGLPGTRVTLEGFNPSTGKTIWSLDAGHDAGLIDQTLLPAQIGPDTIALPANGGYVAVDLSTGHSHAISTGTPGWCRRDTPYRQSVPYLAGNGEKLTGYFGQDGLFSCNAAGRPAAAGATVPSYVAQIGVQTGGLIAWSDRTGVTAAP